MTEDGCSVEQEQPFAYFVQLVDFHDVSVCPSLGPDTFLTRFGVARSIYTGKWVLSWSRYRFSTFNSTTSTVPCPMRMTIRLFSRLTGPTADQLRIDCL
jgi:hypothetical protein